VDEKIMQKLDADLEKLQAKRNLEEARKMMDEIKVMARDWAIRQYALKSFAGEVGNLTEREFIKSIWPQALDEGRKMHEFVNSEEYEKRKKTKGKEKQAKPYFYEGMDPVEKKKREILLEKVTKQYLEAYATGEEIELEESLAADN
jgi:hypothetical protein